LNIYLWKVHDLIALAGVFISTCGARHVSGSARALSIQPQNATLVRVDLHVDGQIGEHALPMQK
jgi:hypothetical protein